MISKATFKNHAEDFFSWLRRQSSRNDPVGDFAADWCDGGCCQDAPIYHAQSVVDHMRQVHHIADGSPAMNAARSAWREYLQEL